MIFTNRDSWVFARCLAGRAVNGELHAVSAPFRPLAERLYTLPGADRERAFEAAVALRDDANAIKKAVRDADPDGPFPEAEEPRPETGDGAATTTDGRNAHDVAPTDRHGATVTHRMIHGQPIPDATLDALPAEWLDLALAARDAQPMPGDSKSPTGTKWASVRMTLDAQRARHGDEFADRLKAALDATEAGPWDLTTDPTTQKRFTDSIIGSSCFAAKKFERKWLVKGIMTLGQPCIVGGPRKAMKTTTMVDLAVSIGTATPFLGEYAVPQPRRVLFLSGESGDPTIQETALRVCKAKGIDMEELEGQAFWGFDLPQLSDTDDLEALGEFIKATAIEVVIIDPLYLCLLSGNSKLDPANLFDVGPLLKRITTTCLDAGATPILVHHLRKNRDDPKAPPELEDLAFAGVQEFARQWILIGRRAAYEPGTGEHQLWLNVGGSAGHSGCWAVDVAEGVIGDEFEGRDWRVTIAKAAEARAEVEQQAAAARIEKQAAKAAEKAAAKAAEDQADMKTALDAFVGAEGHRLTTSGLRKVTGWRKEKADHIIHLLVKAGALVPDQVPTDMAGGRTQNFDGFRMTDGGSE